MARPVGGVVVGQVGDLIGRKSLLQFSLVLIGASTFLMGCLPSFHSIGYWAPALLVLLRFVQGFALGGEWGGAVLLVTEHSPNKSCAFWGSFPQAGVPLGNLLATVVLLVLSVTLSEDAFLAWGRSEEHTSELQSLMRISYAVFCLKTKHYIHNTNQITNQHSKHLMTTSLLDQPRKEQTRQYSHNHIHY